MKLGAHGALIKLKEIEFKRNSPKNPDELNISAQKYIKPNDK